MRETRVICDFCGGAIEKVESKNNLKYGILNELFPKSKVDLSTAGIECCENCALKIDYDLLKLKTERLV